MLGCPAMHHETVHLGLRFTRAGFTASKHSGHRGSHIGLESLRPSLDAEADHAGAQWISQPGADLSAPRVDGSCRRAATEFSDALSAESQILQPQDGPILQALGGDYLIGTGLPVHHGRDADHGRAGLA